MLIQPFTQYCVPSGSAEIQKPVADVHPLYTGCGFNSLKTGVQSQNSSKMGLYN